MSDRPDRDERRDGDPSAGEVTADDDARTSQPDGTNRNLREPDAGIEHEDDEEWAISLSDLREREEVDELAQLREADPEPGTVSLESAAFVLLGAAVCVLLLYVGFL